MSAALPVTALRTGALPLNYLSNLHRKDGRDGTKIESVVMIFVFLLLESQRDCEFWRDCHHSAVGTLGYNKYLF